jgi:GNAT superfamily N-acetyltransferase
VEAEQAGSPRPAPLDVILRDATAADDAALASFDLGSGTPWLEEVIEIVDGLIAWRDDPAERAFDRRVVVAEDDDEIIAVAAHERLEHERVGVLSAHRYLMVVAVRHDRQRTGLARTITEAVITELQSDGVQSVSWLVHPRNTASIEFSRRVFPEADESSPPEDKPYVRFDLGL